MAALKNRDVLLPVQGNRQRLAQLAVALGLLWRGALAHHRVQPVVAHVPATGLHRRGQANAFVLELFFLLFVVAHGHDVAGAHVQPLNGRGVVVALHELGLQGHAFFFDVKHHFVHKGRGLAAVVQVAFFFVARLAFAGVRLAPVVGVALQHVAAVLGELGQHEGAGAHRPVVERQVFLRHAGLGIKLFGLPGHGREKRHRQPVLELGVLADDPNAQRVFVGRAHALQRKLAKVQKR